MFINEECLMLYYQNGNILFADVFSFRDPFKEIEFKVINELTYKNSEILDELTSAPTWCQVIDFFVVKYGIFVIVDTSLIKFYKNDELQSIKFQFVIEDLINRDNDYLFHSADENLFYFDYKEAREQAILKCIKLLKKLDRWPLFNKINRANFEIIELR